MAEYQLTASPFTVIRTADGANIPADSANRDWIEYEEWRMNGGIPDPYPVPLGSSQYDWGAPVIKIIGEY